MNHEYCWIDTLIPPFGQKLFTHLADPSITKCQIITEFDGIVSEDLT